MRIFLQKPSWGIAPPYRRNQTGGDPSLFDLFGARVEIFAFEAVDHFAEAHVARVGVDASTAAREDVVGVWVADGTALAGEDFGTGWAVVFGGHGCILEGWRLFVRRCDPMVM
jgi:hypothetical protein